MSFVSFSLAVIFKDEIKLLPEVKANKFLSYISDRIWLRSLSNLAEIFEKWNNLNLKLQGNGTNIIQLHDESAMLLSEVATLALSSNARKRCYV